MFKLKNRLSLIIAITMISGAVWAAVASISSKEARQAIANIPGLEIDSRQIQIRKIYPGFSSNSATVDAQLDLGFRMEKKREWRVAEIRLADGKWEDMELVTTAIRNEKIKRTTARLQALATAIANYQREQGYYPRVQNIVELTDLLVPRYMNVVTRDDLWSTLLQYQSDGSSYRLQSLGPDVKKLGDEITIENGKLTPSPEEEHNHS